MIHLKYLNIFLKRIGWLLVLYSISRFFFYINNIDSFQGVTNLEFIEGIRFDISALAYINIPLFILLLIPFDSIKRNKYYIRITNIIFYIINIPFIIFNNIDIEYFQFIEKRSTYDLIQLLQLGEDAGTLIPHFIFEYWPITLLIIIQSSILLKVKYIPMKNIKTTAKSILIAIVLFLISSTMIVIAARGGLQLKPIKPIDAGSFSQVYKKKILKNNEESNAWFDNSALILNTPFSLLHSFKENDLEDLNYYNNNQLNNIFSPEHNFNQSIKKKPNIIILIMESFSKEFIGKYNTDSNSYTPFLDSLMGHSLVFQNAYANGIKSIEALPAITASLPTLMHNPLITSRYMQNKFESLASILRKENYITSFFHGGKKGTMGFYGYSIKAGFEKYYGMEEYTNNNKDFDGFWGIYDEPFFNYFADKLDEKKQPFFTTFFSLSSHPPYSIPDEYKDELSSKNKKVHQSIKYADFSLKQFFKSIKHKDWFRNTIFIITADHTSPEQFKKKYKNRGGRFAIPMIWYRGNDTVYRERNNIVQQIDIMPSILDYIGYTKPFVSFGKSMFSNESWAITKLQEEYYLFSDNGINIQKNNNYFCFKDWGFTKNKPITKEDTQLLKAIRQSYNIRMKDNQLTIK